MSDQDIELHPQTLRIDEKLERLEDEIDWLGRLTPTNIDAVWTGFCESGFKPAPAFTLCAPARKTSPKCGAISCRCTSMISTARCSRRC